MYEYINPEFIKEADNLNRKCHCLDQFKVDLFVEAKETTVSRLN